MPLPFPVEHQEAGEACAGSQCAIRSLLPDELQERAEAAPHLMEYLHLVPIKDVGVPDYYESLNRNLSDLDYRNLIYPVGNQLFVHIYPDPSDARDFYVAVEPAMLQDVSVPLQEIERRLLDYVEDLSDAETEEQRAALMMRVVDENCVVTDPENDEGGGGANGTKANGAGAERDGTDALGEGDAGEKDGAEGEKKKTAGKAKATGKKGGGLFGFLSKGSGSGKPLQVTAAEKAALKYVLVRDKLKMGVLEPLINDEHIEDISCSGLGQLFIEHKIFKGLKSNITFDSHEVLDDFVLRLAERIQKPVTYRNPIVDATLPDGSRINIVFGADVSKSGSNFTIRKFTATPLSIVDIIMSGGVDATMAGYLSLIVGEGLNLFVSGETASGKTTLLNALAGFVAPDAKIVSIEDTAEFQVPHPNWIREIIRGSMSEGDSGVTMFTLLKAALRQRPNLIVIGEIRGEEGAVAFQAMQTGHAVMATFHASTVEKLIQRMTGNPIDVPKVYIDNLNVVVIASSVRLPNGKPGRRIMSVNELVGYDKAADAFSFVEVFRWNSSEDVHEFTGNMNSYLLENIIAPKRGFSPANKRGIYQELERRAALFQRLVDQGTNDFYDLYKVFSKAQREGLL